MQVKGRGSPGRRGACLGLRNLYSPSVRKGRDKSNVLYQLCYIRWKEYLMLAMGKHGGRLEGDTQELT